MRQRNTGGAGSGSQASVVLGGLGQGNGINGPSFLHLQRRGGLEEAN